MVNNEGQQLCVHRARGKTSIHQKGVTLTDYAFAALNTCDNKLVHPSVHIHSLYVAQPVPLGNIIRGWEINFSKVRNQPVISGLRVCRVSFFPKGLSLGQSVAYGCGQRNSIKLPLMFLEIKMDKISNGICVIEIFY